VSKGEKATSRAGTAVGKVGQGASDRVSETVGGAGTALAAVAGLGVFFFATGYFVEWQRMKRGGLPPEQVLPLVPKTQIAASGVRELAISILLGGLILALIGFGLVGLAKLTKGRSGRIAKQINGLLERRVVAVPTALIGLITVLLVPFDRVGVLAAVTVTGLLCFCLLSVSRFLAGDENAKFPLWRLTLAIALAAVVLSGARQHEFPEPRPKATVVFRDGTVFEATYIASDADKILLRLRQKGVTELIVLHSDDLQSVQLTKSPYVFPRDPSLLDRVVDLAFPRFRLSCIPPECRWRENTAIGPSSFF
jgi:hypothetical protein